MLNGARQTGKSTLAQSLPVENSRRYFTLAAAKGDPDGFIAGLSVLVTLDGVQRSPELFLFIEASVDRDRSLGRFLLMGSANVLLLPDIADSLAGRMEILSLWPLSNAEIAGAPTINLADWLFDGSMNAFEISPCDRAQLIEKILRGVSSSVESGIGHLAAALEIMGAMLYGPPDPECSGIWAGRASTSLAACIVRAASSAIAPG